MADSLDQFIKRVTDIGLHSEGDIETLLDGLPAGQRPRDGEQLARELVRQEKLTDYQAKAIQQGTERELVLGNYVIQDKLGQGGMGMVLKAEHKRMGRLVALKVLAPEAVKSPDAVQRFHREVQAAARLEHPNIVIAFDADEANGTHFLVMQYVEGKDLSALVKEQGSLSVDKAVSCVLQAARGLEYAHAEGVIHRDIKPANLLLDSKGVVKILDMGLARLEGSASDLDQAELTGTGQIMGTVDYMPPEQALSTKSADARSDIYSLGITFWYLMTGRAAYDGETLMAKMLAHRETPVPSLTAIRSDASAELESVFAKMVAKKSEDRYQSMSEVVVALEHCSTTTSSHHSLTASSSETGKLSELPGKLEEQTQSVTEAAAKPDQTVQTQPDEEFAATVNVDLSAVDTDPQTLTSLQASSESPGHRRNASRGWWQDRRVKITGGCLALIACVLLVVFNGREVEEDPFDKAGPAVTGVDPSPKSPETNHCLLFDGVGSYVSFPELQLELNNQFTIEMMLNPRERLNDTETLVRMQFPDDRNLAMWVGQRCGVSMTASEQKYWVGPEYLRQGAHVVTVFDGDELRMYARGKLIGKSSTPTVGDVAESSEFVGTIGVTVRAGKAQVQNAFHGTIDEVRISSIARYTQDFVPPRPDDRFEADDNTLALYHFDEGQGTIAHDSSGNGHDGTIVNAKWVPTGGASIEYQVVEALVARGAEVHLRTVEIINGTDRVEIKQLDDLRPLKSVPFRVHYVRSSASHQLTDEDLALIGRLDSIDKVYLFGCPDVTDRGVESIRHVRISSLTLTSTPITNASLPILGSMSTLTLLKIENSRIDDQADIQQLAGLKNLSTLHLPKVESDAVQRLHRALPHCLIASPSLGALMPFTEFAIEPAGGPKADSHLADLPKLPNVLALSDSMTIEMTVSARSHAGPGESRVLWSYAGKLELKQHQNNLTWQFNSPDQPGIEQVIMHDMPLRQPLRLAAVSNGKALRLYVNGKLVGSRDLKNDLPANRPPMFLASWGDSASGYSRFDGTIDEIRISKIARYVGDAAPVGPLEADADTLALYHCDEGRGDVLKDSSGNGHDATIIGAKWVSPGTASGPPHSVIDFADFAGVADELQLNGDSAIDGSTLQLVPDEYGKTGSAFFKRKLRLADGFVTEFLFRAHSDKRKEPGDGFAFVIQNDSPQALGELGAELGFSGEASGIRSALAIQLHFSHTIVEFCNSGRKRLGYRKLNRLASTQCRFRAIDTPFLARVEYRPAGELTLTISDPEDTTTIWSHTIDVDLRDLAVVDEDGAAWIGFTAGTAAFFGKFEILSWTVKSLTDPERAAARWVLGFSQRVDLDVDGRTVIVTDEGELPHDKPYTLRKVWLPDVREWSAGDLRNLKGIKQLESLDFYRTPVTDRDMADLELFPTLSSITLNAGNKVTDQGLARLHELVSLQSFRLHTNSQVSDNGMQHLAKAKTLRSIRFFDVVAVSDTGLKHLKQLTNLESILIQGTQVTEDGIADLKKALPDCEIRWDGSTDAYRAAAKWALGIGGTIETEAGEITDAAQLPQTLILVVRIDVAGNPRVTDDELGILDDMTHLKTLHIQRTQIGDSGLKHFEGLKHLSVLDLGYTQVSDTGLQHLKGLTDLSVLGLADTQVGDAGLQHLKGLTKLTNLDLSDTKVTSQGIAGLKKALPGCEIIWAGRQ